MKIGYLKLVETLRLLTQPKPVDGLESIHLYTLTGKHIVEPSTVIVGYSEVFAETTDNVHMQIPFVEIASLGVEFGVTAKGADLPTVLAARRPTVTKPTKEEVDDEAEAEEAE